jgi:RNA polymerase sigma-70 factor (sigma-E family)
MPHGADEFTEFAAARSGKLFRTAWLLTGDWHLAQDLVQETLGKMYAKWRRMSGVQDPAAYAHTVLVRTFISHRRRRSSSERPTERMPERPATDGDADLRLTLLDGLAKLGKTDRAVLVLRYWEDRSVEATADELGVSEGAVKSRSFRALERLRVVLADTDDELSAIGSDT